MLISSAEFPGFYEIDGFSRYVVNRRGIVIDRVSGDIRHCGKNPDGYYNYFLYRDDGTRTTLGRHRLLGVVFIPTKRDITKLVINHKNGIKGDDRIENLEWLTQKENIEHAGALGISSKCLPVSVRDSVTGLTKDFPSIIECARYFDMTKEAVSYRACVGMLRVFPEKRQYRFKTNLDWYVSHSLENDLKRNRDNRSMLVRHVFYNLVKEFRRAEDARFEDGIHPSTMSKWLSLEGQPILPGLLQVKWSSDVRPWRHVEDPIAEYNILSKFSKIVHVMDEVTGKRYYFTNAISCCKHLGLKPTMLDYRLKSCFETVFSDNMRYGYYTHSPTDQKWSDGILLN